MSITTYQMSEEERLAYIEKHPIKRKKIQKSFAPDYRWRGEKGAAATKASFLAKKEGKVDES